jgi:uncharacterized protein
VTANVAGPRPAIDVVRDLWRTFKSDPAAIDQFFHPDAKTREAASLPHGGDWTGGAGVRALHEIIDAHWVREHHGVEILDAGDCAIVVIQGRFTSRLTGAAVDGQVVEIFRVVDGLIVENNVFYKDTAALLASHSSLRAVSEERR